MTLTAWLSIVAVCGAGAMSPGPSLAVVMRNTVKGGQLQGVITSLSHALGIMFYAFISVVGIGVLITKSPLVFDAVKYAGAAFLAFLGYRALSSKPKVGALPDTSTDPKVTYISSARDGLLISILNPKIILFFLALFSQFVQPDADWTETAIITATAGVIDGGWYIIVALFVSQSDILRWLQKRMEWIEKCFGALLIAIAVRVVL